MVHTCSALTDIAELIGSDRREGPRVSFQYGPLALAMKAGEELVLENSGALSVLMVKKLSLILGDLYVDDTAEVIQPTVGFRLTLR